MRGGGEIVGIVGWLEEIQQAVDAARAAGEVWVSLERELPGEGSSNYRPHESVRVRPNDVVAISGPGTGRCFALSRLERGRCSRGPLLGAAPIGFHAGEWGLGQLRDAGARGRRSPTPERNPGSVTGAAYCRPDIARIHRG